MAGVYVHIPFCKQRCVYCDFYSTIDAAWQDQHKGTKALIEFITYMKTVCNAKQITTTYIYGNEHARHIYEKAGFVETDVVDEPDCHEVNMAIDL